MTVPIDNSASHFLLHSQTINLKTRGHSNYVLGSTHVIFSVNCLAQCWVHPDSHHIQEGVMVIQEARRALGRGSLERCMSYRCD